jgi:hypothetical protein
VSIINIYHSAFENSYDTIIVEKNTTIQEALPELDYENSLIYVDGFETDENYIFKDNDICTIRIFPEGASIVIGALLIGAVAYFVTDAIVAGVTGKTIWQHVKQGLLSWLAPDVKDTATNTADSLEGIPQLKGAKNQSNRNKPIPLVLGEHLFTPMFIGSPYTEIAGTDGEDQYYNALYLLGWGKLRVKDIKLGPVSGLAKNSTGITDGLLLYDKYDGFCDPSFAAGNPQLELRQGASEVTLYPQRVVEERLSIELMNVEGENPLEVIRFSAKNPQKVQIEIMFNNGLISYNEKGEKQNAYVAIKVEWRGNPAGAWQEFGRFGTNGGSSPTNYNSPVTTISRQKAKVMRFVAERSFNMAEVSAAIDRTLELRIIRTNAKATDNRTIDTVFLTAIRTWCFDYEASQAAGTMVTQKPMIQKYRDQTARLGFRIKATDNLQGTIDALNCMVTSYARTWNGSNWSSTETPTNNPASVALKILQSPALGNNAYPDSMLDLDSFGEFFQWCANREYTCNGVLTSEKRVDDLLSAVLSTGRGMRILNGNRYAVLIDKPRENPVTILNSQNVLEAKNQKNFEDLPDGFSIKFINKDDGFQETEVYVMADGSARPQPTSRIESIEVPFITDYKQVIRNGRYTLACRRLRPEIWIRKLSTDGYLVGIGNRVDVQDDTIVVGIGEGAAITGLKIENNTIVEIQTDGVFDIIDMDKLYGIKIMQFDGVNPGKVRTIQVAIPETGIYSNFQVSISLNSNPPIPHVGDIVSFGIYDRITTPALCFGKKANGDGTFEVTLIPYQEGIYTTDSGPIPPYEANITTPQGLAPINTIPPDQVTKSELIEIASEFAGASATVYRLRPSAEVIKKYQNGVISPDTIYCEQFSITGSGQPTPSYKIIKYQTNLTQGEVFYTGPLDVSDNCEYIRFSLYDDNVLLDYEDIPVLADGIPANIFELLPSVNIVRILESGMIDPGKVSCVQQLRTGNNSPVTSHKTLVYITSANSVETPYTGPVTINPAWNWIEFRLYDGMTLLDAERVAIICDSIDSFTVDLLFESIAIPCDEYGDPKPQVFPITNKADFYTGLTQAVAVWELINAPTGVSIDSLGVIRIQYSSGYADINKVTVRGTYNGIIRESVLTITKVLDGVDPVTLDINPDSETISYDHNGVPHPGQLSFTMKATLYKGTKEVTDLLWGVDGFSLRRKMRNQIILFPGSGTDIFSPLATGVYPVSTQVLTWFLTDEPIGVTIDQNGIITVSPNVVLANSNIITVNVVFEGVTYSKAFTLNRVQDGAPGIPGQKGEQGEPAPKYLGKTVTKTTTNTVYIKYTDTYSANVTANIGDYIAYVGVSDTGSSAWKKNYCLRWNGTQWEQLDPLNSTYTDYYMRALRDITEGAELGVFSALFAQKIMAMEATITELTSKTLKLHDGGNIHSNNYSPGVSGFVISYNGNAEFNNGVFRGTLAAKNIFISGSVDAGNSYVLRSNNMLVEVSDVGGRSGDWYRLKSIITYARGSASLYYEIKTRIADIHNCYARIYINGARDANLHPSIGTNLYVLLLSDTGRSVIDIELYYEEGGGRPIGGYGAGVGRFELMVRDDPGMLAALG